MGSFDKGSLGCNKQNFESWLDNVLVLTSRKVGIFWKLEGQTRGSCILSVLAKLYCGCLTIMLDIDMKNTQRNDDLLVAGFTLSDSKRARSATEISMAICLLASAAHEWGEGGRMTWVVLGASTDVEQAVDNVTPLNLSDTMRETGVACDSD